jgi:hypothetical protein
MSKALGPVTFDGALAETETMPPIERRMFERAEEQRMMKRNTFALGTTTTAVRASDTSIHKLTGFASRFPSATEIKVL